MYGDTVPLAVFGVIALLAGLLVTFMPETSNTPLPDTISVSWVFADLFNKLIVLIRMERILGLVTAFGLPVARGNLIKLLKYRLY